MPVRSHRSLRFEPLEARQMMSVNVTETEPNDKEVSANAFTLPADGIVHLLGTSQSKKDKDFFKFTPTEDVTLHLNVDSPSGRPVQLEVSDSQGNDLFETEPNDGINGGQVDLSAGLTYFFRLRNKDKSGPAEYDARVATTPGGGGGGGGGGDTLTESESNNTKGSADAFDLGNDGLIHLLGTSQDHDDKDFFRFTAATSGTLSVNVAATNAVFAQFEIEDAFGNDLFETEPNDGVNSGSLNVVAGQTYFIRLRATDDAPAGYDVELSLT